ncbi:hypothetical protein DFP72DRAFT_97925 [Ephemerocybe angulata]|uniref:Phospholipid/glycerol acyltransferase domain-containing protein n=1 Tax=Ephemerocybe angulata TaxID=980116 RepID=A0A8H6I7A4_9AGAR|nr:hypothetical protein DFP72DRAFT_97925 [Tulosesus angulatus]
MAKGEPTPAPVSFIFIRLFFRLALNTFYGSIVVENGDYVPESGKPCIICPNHSNSVMDAPVVAITVPTNRRKLVRFTAKASLFGKPTFSSWLIVSTRVLPRFNRRFNMLYIVSRYLR